NVCEAYNLKAGYEIMKGVDPAVSVQKALDLCGKAADMDQNMDFIFLNLGVARNNGAIMTLADSARAAGFLNQARTALNHAFELNPGYPDVLLAQARSEIVAARLALQKGQSVIAPVAAAHGYLQKALKLNAQYFDAFLALAEIDRIQAESLTSMKKPA